MLLLCSLSSFWKLRIWHTVICSLQIPQAHAFPHFKKKLRCALTRVPTGGAGVLKEEGGRGGATGGGGGGAGGAVCICG